MAIYRQRCATVLLGALMDFFAGLFKRTSPTESTITRALKAVSKTNTDAARKDLHEALSRQRLILPIRQEPENVKRDELGRLLETMRVDPVGYQDSTGKKFLAVFTYPDAMKSWTAELPKWVVVDTPSICVMAIESGYSATRINPGSLESAELSTEEINALAQKFPVEP